MKKILVMAAGLAISAGIALASGGSSITAEEALNKLMEGNKHYVENKMTSGALCSAPTRESLAKGQKPYAIVLSCSDSRVPPEIIFDKGLGEIFVVRVAGNVVDPVTLGSIEYAAEHLGSPLVVVLGHERCGAVTAAVDAKGKPEGNIGAIVKSIAPAVKKAKSQSKDSKKKEGTGYEKVKLVECAIDENVKLVAGNITKQSAVLKELVKKGKVKIVTAKYDLDDGLVTLLKD